MLKLFTASQLSESSWADDTSRLRYKYIFPTLPSFPSFKLIFALLIPLHQQIITTFRNKISDYIIHSGPRHPFHIRLVLIFTLSLPWLGCATTIHCGRDESLSFRACRWYSLPTFLRVNFPVSYRKCVFIAP